MITTFPFSDNVAYARRIRGFSVAQLAAAVGVSPSAISHYEAGDRTPGADTLIRLADVLSVSTDYLLGRSADIEAGGAEAAATLGKLGQLSSEEQETVRALLDTLVERRTT